MIFDDISLGDTVKTWNSHIGKVTRIFENKYFGKTIRIQEEVNGTIYNYTFPVKDIIEIIKDDKNEM